MKLFLKLLIVSNDLDSRIICKFAYMDLAIDGRS